MKDENDFFIEWLKKKFKKDFSPQLKEHNRIMRHRKINCVLGDVLRMLWRLKLNENGKRYIDEHYCSFDELRRSFEWTVDYIKKNFLEEK